MLASSAWWAKRLRECATDLKLVFELVQKLRRNERLDEARECIAAVIAAAGDGTSADALRARLRKLEVGEL